MNFFNPVVQDRISKTLGYFGGGLFITGGLIGALRASPWAYVNPFLLLGIGLGTLYGTMLTSYEKSPVLKHAFWMSFMSIIALLTVPVINMASMPIIFDALFATGFTMGGLGLVAYNAPSEQFLKWGGMLGMCGAGLAGISIAQILWPR
jgi:FtsH-binding integral membrane protein